MPQKVLKFTGINRKVNEFQNSGACEELINLRPKPNGGCEIVRNKSEFISSVKYDQFIEHAWGKYDHQIYVTDGVVYWRKAADEISIVTEAFTGEDISVSTAGNVLVVYCEDKSKQLAFKFEDEEYRPFTLDLIKIEKAAINHGLKADGRYASAYYETDDFTITGLQDAISRAEAKFYNTYPNGLCGVAVVGCTYVLEDNSEFWSTAFVVADARVAPYVGDGSNMDTRVVDVYGAEKVTLNLSFTSSNTDVKKINVYASRPISASKFGTNREGEIKPISELSLDSQLMYYQGSLEGNQRSITLNFGITQAGEGIMDVTAGCVERTGRAVSYNNRFHCFGSTLEHVIQVPTVTHTADTSGTTWIPYVKFKEGWRLIDADFELDTAKANNFIYPLSDIEQMAFVKATNDANGNILSVPYSEMFYVDMKDSAAYNYSFAFDFTPAIVSAGDFKAEMEKIGQVWSSDFAYDKKILLNEESNAINVSAPYNPFVFPVNYSYSFGGEIKDIATSYLPISSTQVGQYPITVFTTNGIYALEQGSGAVLYGNVVPLQPHVIEGKALSTPHGTFFASSKNLYVLSGREAFSVSQALDGHRELNVRGADAFKKLCLGGSSLHSFANEVSMLDFRDFISGGCSLTYDQLNNEVLISRHDVSYSYVFNINTKAFHKVPKKYAQAMSNSRYVIETTGETKNVVDLHTEATTIAQHIMMLSRPFSLEAFYTHIDRLILFADASLDESWGHNLCLSVFASDNLNDWKCIISAQKHDTIFRQIRTNRAARSYKDYMILINGTVSADTDLSEIIADYTVVSRRLG